MVLRNPISGTKRFLQRTLQSVKSMFSITISTGVGGGGGGYRKLPKYDMNSLTEATRIGFHHNFSEEIAGSSAASAVDGIKQTATLRAAKTEGKRGSATHEGKRWWVAEKLREMLEPGDVDHSVDIEEVLHYYSRLTCPAYLDIVDRFLMEMYLEFISSPEMEMAVVGGGDSGWRRQPRRISL